MVTEKVRKLKYERVSKMIKGKSCGGEDWYFMIPVCAGSASGAHMPVKIQPTCKNIPDEDKRQGGQWPAAS